MTMSAWELLPDLLWLNFTIVNAFLVGYPEQGSAWVLVDTGFENSAEFIIKSAKKRFGAHSKPRGVILTHAHFGQVGSADQLATYWDVPVYIHPLELPQIIDYASIDLSFRALALPADNSCPGMPGWKWIHTPGHTEGHVSLFRDQDRVLLMGDAFALTKDDWIKAERSIKRLRDLYPALAIPSHGEPLSEAEFNQHMDVLISNLGTMSKPSQGQFFSRH